MSTTIPKGSSIAARDEQVSTGHKMASDMSLYGPQGEPRWYSQRKLAELPVSVLGSLWHAARPSENLVAGGNDHNVYIETNEKLSVTPNDKVNIKSKEKYTVKANEKTGDKNNDQVNISDKINDKINVNKTYINKIMTNAGAHEKHSVKAGDKCSVKTDDKFYIKPNAIGGYKTKSASNSSIFQCSSIGSGHERHVTGGNTNLAVEQWLAAQACYKMAHGAPRD